MPQASEITNKEFELEEEILAPYTHLLQIKGKQLRRKIALAFNHWLRLPDEKLRQVVDLVNLLHVGTLLLDDVQDNALQRRAIPAAHRVFGIPLTINTSVHVFFLFLEKVVKLHPKGAEICAEEFLDALRGQGSELYWRDNFLCPTEEQYKNMAKRKTGRMFTLGVRLCQLFSEYKSDLCHLALLLGLYFQIRDDYCNLIQQEEQEEWPGVEDNIKQKAEKNTSYCEDLTEGKYSFPIIHAMNTPERGPISNILRQRTSDVDLKKYCVSLLEKAGSLQYTRDVMQDLDRCARAEELLAPYHHIQQVKGKRNLRVKIILAFNHWLKVPKETLQYALDALNLLYNETGSTYVMAVRTLQLFSEDETDYTEFIKLLGLYYQIRDDYCNLSQQEALDQWPSAEEAQRTRDVEVKKYCLSLLEKAGSLQYTRERRYMESIPSHNTHDVRDRVVVGALAEGIDSIYAMRDVLQDLDSAARAEVNRFLHHRIIRRQLHKKNFSNAIIVKLARFGGNPEMEAVLDDLLSWKDQKAFST